ncbi:hypothetical protein K501DRAFT_329074 [Backusella circina FSU 941]|nr:hypothetical protein K501DRAFT_329074 [Backusella circina FSU 941]
MAILIGRSENNKNQKEGLTDQSRAFFVTSRSLQIFENKGIAHRMLHEAYILRGAQLFIEGGECTSLDADVSGSPFPQLTSLPQSKTESILSSIIQDEKNTQIHWKETLTSYTEEGDHVVATLSTENGFKSIRARYMIGADGSHSTVRKCNPSWKYEGYSAETKFALADVSLSGPGVDKLKNKYNIFYHSDGMCLVIPIKYEHGDNNLFRVIANMGPYDKREMKDQAIVTHGICKTEDDTLSLEQVNEMMATRTENLGLVAKDPRWITHFHINERKANGYRCGRAFLMGDAAHCHSPVGGQGMNLGLQDADNLAWKMSLVLKGQSSNPEMLLNSYSSESEPIAENSITQTGNATELMMSVGFVMAILRYFVSTSAFGTEKLKEYSMMSMLQNIGFQILETGGLVPKAKNNGSKWYKYKLSILVRVRCGPGLSDCRRSRLKQSRLIGSMKVDPNVNACHLTLGSRDISLTDGVPAEEAISFTHKGRSLRPIKKAEPIISFPT